MPHLGQLTVEGFFVTSTMAPQSLQMMRALIETVAVFLSLFDSAMASPFPFTDFFRLGRFFEKYQLYQNPALEPQQKRERKISPLAKGAKNTTIRFNQAPGCSALQE
jgi:hypothetical protein